MAVTVSLNDLRKKESKIKGKNSTRTVTYSFAINERVLLALQLLLILVTYDFAVHEVVLSTTRSVSVGKASQLSARSALVSLRC